MAVIQTLLTDLLQTFIANQNSNNNFLNAKAGLVGEIKAFAGATAPTGTLLCDGTAVSRSTYAALFAAIGTAWGVGDDSTTFNVPNLCNYFLRGASSTLPLGTVQQDAMQYHYHLINRNTTGDELTEFYVGTGSGGSSISPTSVGNGTFVARNMIADAADGGGTPRGAAETRPVNKAVNYIIVY